MARLRSKKSMLTDSREEVVLRLVDSPCPDLDPVLQDFPQADHAGLLEEAQERFFATREEEREPLLLERLQNLPPPAWGSIFAERPDLEDRLTVGQRARWNTWLHSARTPVRETAVRKEVR